MTPATPLQTHLLVVDDDDRIRGLLARYLATKGHRVSSARNAKAARRLLDTLDFDLLILDIMMPGEDGLSLLDWWRQRKQTPVILLTARGEASDRIEGLRKGADDYIPKPFEPEELALRIDAILRRAPKPAPIEDIALSGLTYSPARDELRRGETYIRLTDAEQTLLRLLSERLGEPVSREALAALTSAGVERTVDVQVTRLRRKIEPDPKEPIHLQTVRGVGYRLMPDK